MKKYNLLLITALTLVSFATTAQAFDSRKCNKILNAGSFKAYKYQGVGEGASSSTSQGTRHDGSTKVSSESETESTTSSVDPGITTNYGISTGEYSSSFGDCDSFALNTIRQERDHYVVLNSDELKKEIAVGHGQFLSMLDDYTLCTDQALPALHEQLRQNFDSLVDQSPETMSKKIMSIISSDSKLRATCDTI